MPSAVGAGLIIGGATAGIAALRRRRYPSR
jgi:hypothetical protein